MVQSKIEYGSQLELVRNEQAERDLVNKMEDARQDRINMAWGWLTTKVIPAFTEAVADHKSGKSNGSGSSNGGGNGGGNGTSDNPLSGGPTVAQLLATFDKEALDGIIGVLPEKELKSWIQMVEAAAESVPDDDKKTVIDTTGEVTN